MDVNNDQKSDVANEVEMASERYKGDAESDASTRQLLRKYNAITT